MIAIDVREAFRIHRWAGATSVALQGLTLQVEEGEIVVVLGPSGSGKTTLLRTVGGFDTLSAGTARVLGVDVGALGPGAVAGFRARNLGLLDQHYARALSPDLTSEQKSSILGMHTLRGEEFDRAYMAAVREHQKEAMDRFEEQRDKGSNILVRSYAAKNYVALKRLAGEEKLPKAE